MFTGVVQVTGVGTQDGNTGAIAGLKRIHVGHDYRVLAGLEQDIRELELNTAVQLEVVYIQRNAADILDFDELEVVGVIGVADAAWRRVVHDFSNAQTRRARKIALSRHGAPGVLEVINIVRLSRTGRNADVRIDGNRARIEQAVRRSATSPWIATVQRIIDDG